MTLPQPHWSMTGCLHRNRVKGRTLASFIVTLILAGVALNLPIIGREPLIIGFFVVGVAATFLNMLVEWFMGGAWKWN